MSTSVVHYPHSIYFPGGTEITQMSDVTPAHNFVDLSEFAASQAAPQFAGSHQASPDNRFTSTQLKTILDLVAGGDQNVIRDFSGSGTVQVEYKAGQNLGVRIADGDNAGVYGLFQDNAALVWESLRARQGGLVEARCRLVAIFLPSSGNDPLVWSASVDLAGTADVAHLFTLGKIALNGSALTGVEEIEWNNNIEYEEVASEGEPFPTYFGVRRYRPVLRIMTNNLAYLNTYGTRGTALTNCTCFLRKKLLSGINVADATAQHIRLQATDGTNCGVIKALQAGDSKGMCTLEVHLRSTAEDTCPFTINTAIAIT